MRRYTLEIGRTDMGGTHLNLVDENGRETGQLCLGELLEQITGLAVAEGWPGLRQPEVYPMETSQQHELRRERARTAARSSPFELPHPSL
jgi:hypothetical protein